MDLIEIAAKWQKYWDENKTFQVTEDSNKEKYYVLDMFPYPSGVGLHIGHTKGYTATDVIAKKKKMEGKNVLHPMGWDAFGLPAENYAMKNKVHPSISTNENIANFTNQQKSVGFGYDWTREVNTTDPKFYKWTQWIFLKLYNHYYDETLNKAMPIEKLAIPAGLNEESKAKYIDSQRLAFVDFKPINWCPDCKTGLANEDLEDGNCERCGSEIEQKPMRQWVLRITKYAERLLQDIGVLDQWEDSIKEMQKNWIGRSEGTEFDMAIDGAKDKGFSVYTTRVDTVFGMTFVAMSPEHPLVAEITTDECKEEVEAYQDKARKKTALERTELQKDKTGVFCGAYAINPFNGDKVPVYIADYVLADYGTGVVMAVPAHDERDWEFAMKYNLPIKQSILRKEIDQRKLFQMLDVIEHINYLARENNIKIYLAGGFAVAFTNGVYYRDNEDIDFIVEKGKADHLKDLLMKNKFAYIDDYAFRKEDIKIEYGEIGDIVEYAPRVEYHLTPDVVTNEYRELLNHKSRAVTREFLVEYRTLQSQSRLKKHDNDALEHLKNGATTEYGILVDSGDFTGLTSEEAKEKMTAWAESKGIGRKQVNFRLQDWVFSRQRYWGEPIPMIHCEKCGVQPMDEKDLPLELPNVEHYEPTGTEEGPLANIADWINTTCPKCGGKGIRESNTMPQWAGSSWYWIRFMDAKNEDALINPEVEKYWNEVDCYVGGAEHATRHLIYGRFWHKFLNDIGVVSTSEPFKRLQHVGLVLGTDGQKISKRAGNGVDPLVVAQEYGADTLRLYQMFMGPFDQAVAFDMNGVKGAKRFLEKVMKLESKISDQEDEKKILSELHKTIKKVSEDIEGFKFNTAISQLMILVKELANQESISKDTFAKFVVLIAPFAPHLAEELWQNLGNNVSIFAEDNWPEYDKELIVDDTIKIAVQVMGKVRSTIEISKDASKEEVLAMAKEATAKRIDGKVVVKEIYVPGKIVNLVVK